MSLRTSDSMTVMEYGAERIERAKSTILVVYSNLIDYIVTPIDSDHPENDFKLIGTIYWDEKTNSVEYHGVNTLS